MFTHFIYFLFFIYFISDIPSAARSLADKAVENIEIAITIAEKNIRSSIALAVSHINIQNDNLKTDAVKLLRKILTKRSTVSGILHFNLEMIVSYGC